MSYKTQAQLADDVWFQARVRAAAEEQADTYKDDQRPDFVAVAEEVLRGSGELVATFVRLSAAGPGIAEKADTGDGTIDSSLVTDGDLLALIQAGWQVVAGLYYDDTGAPIS